MEGFQFKKTTKIGRARMDEQRQQNSECIKKYWRKENSKQRRRN